MCKSKEWFHLTHAKFTLCGFDNYHAFYVDRGRKAPIFLVVIVFCFQTFGLNLFV